MRHALLAFLGLIVFTWLGFELFPGHSYLRGATQLYVPIIERLASPGFLSRDLVATHPNVSYTVYDEVTLFLKDIAGLDFRTGLLLQQILFRLAWLSGLFLTARACGLDKFWSVLVAAIASLGTSLPGASVALLDPEPVPRTFALGLTFLAIGWLAREKPLLAGLSAGIALVYDARVAAPFWIMLLTAFAVDKRIRYLLRPCLPILLVFALLLANLAQLQPGAPQAQDVFARLSASVGAIQIVRTPWVWVSTWAPDEIWHYLAILVIGFWATYRIWFKLNRQLRWMFISLPLMGVLSVPISYTLLEVLRWTVVSQIQPAKTLVFTVAFCLLACAIAGLEAARKRRMREAILWIAVVFFIEMNARILDALNLTHSLYACQSVLALILGGAVAWIAMESPIGNRRLPALLVPCAAMLIIPFAARFDGRGSPEHGQELRQVNQLAQWAIENTWAGSVFAFPDAFQSLQPGVFRANSQRALWVDWESGAQSIYSESFAEEWWVRWQQMMKPPFSPKRLQTMLSLPVDYYVLKRDNSLSAGQVGRTISIPAAFTNDEFVVYEANQLRNAPGILQLTKARPALNYSN